MLSRLFDNIVGWFIDWLFKEDYSQHKSAFERKHGWLPTAGTDRKDNDSGIHPDW